LTDLPDVCEDVGQSRCRVLQVGAKSFDRDVRTTHGPPALSFGLDDERKRFVCGHALPFVGMVGLLPEHRQAHKAPRWTWLDERSAGSEARFQSSAGLR